MASSPGPQRADALARFLLDGPPRDPVGLELEGWLAESPRFRAFAGSHATKIRKKLRGAADADSRRDVRAELQVARLLLADRRVELAFEPYGARIAGPDFALTFRGHVAFNLEVTRMRRTPDAAAFENVLLAKLRQLPPSVANALLVATDGDRAGVDAVNEAVLALRHRADRKDEAFFVGRGYRGTREFYERHLRLGAIVVWREGASQPDVRAELWRNASTRLRLPEPAIRACVACLREGRAGRS